MKSSQILYFEEVSNCFPHNQENIVEVGVTEYNHKIVVVVEESNYNDKVVVVEESNYNENNYSGLQSNYHTDSHTLNNYLTWSPEY